jgi:phage/plasmid-like protein (TIGR03299 family)
MSEPLEYPGKHRSADTGTVWEGTAFEGWTGEGDATVDGWGTAKDIGERAMQDGIEKNADGTASFAAVRHKGWHNLGTVFDKPTPALEMLQAANADYEVFLIEDMGVIRNEAGDIIASATDPRKRKTARRNPVTGELEILGTVAPTYPIFNNRESFVGFGDALTQLDAPNTASCGVLDNGRRAFMSWKLDKNILVGGLDAADLWLMVSTSHDGSQPLRAAVTMVRTVCTNTCRWNWRNAVTKWSIKHTPNAKLAIADATESLKLSYAYAEQWEEMAEQMINAQLSADKFAQIIEENFGPGEDVKPATATKWEKKKDRLMELFTVADTQANCRNTAWAGLQAIGEFQDWDLKVATPGWETNPDGYRLLRSLDEEKTVHGPKQAAFQIFTEYAGVKV